MAVVCTQYLARPLKDFQPIFKKSKNRFFIVFLKMDLANVGEYFLHLRAISWENGLFMCPEELKGGEKCCL